MHFNAQLTDKVKPDLDNFFSQPLQVFFLLQKASGVQWLLPSFASDARFISAGRGRLLMHTPTLVPFFNLLIYLQSVKALVKTHWDM